MLIPPLLHSEDSDVDAGDSEGSDHRDSAGVSNGANDDMDEGGEGGMFDEDEDTRLLVSPGRCAARNRAFENMERQALRMQKRVAKRQGKIELCAGDVVRIAVADVDRGRLDPTTVLMVVVETVVCGEKEQETKYRLACNDGVFKTLMGRYDLELVAHTLPANVGLGHVQQRWQKMATIGYRAAVAGSSLTGGARYDTLRLSRWLQFQEMQLLSLWSHVQFTLSQTERELLQP